MTFFAVVGHTARTDGAFSLNDLPSGGGRMDVLCRCVNASLFLSHNIRQDVECSLVLLGPPVPPKTVKFSGDSVRSLNPDERSPASLIKKALEIPCGSEFRESSAGVAVRKGGLERLLQEHSFGVLDEQGADIRTCGRLPDAFLLSDHMSFSMDDDALIAGCPRFSVGPTILHAESAIVILLNELDRRVGGWK
ncbi:MAG: tRNA (pseudouridine(54)-N(1))-methyltransferase TrmY [Methanoregula sp.]|nr:MAG: tRNA (pseudouridine(54)-N(1))-methyltransferase TrmY [Methanoregula sp.]